MSWIGVRGFTLLLPNKQTTSLSQTANVRTISFRWEEMNAAMLHQCLVPLGSATSGESGGLHGRGISPQHDMPLKGGARRFQSCQGCFGRHGQWRIIRMSLSSLSSEMPIAIQLPNEKTQVVSLLQVAPKPLRSWSSLRNPKTWFEPTAMSQGLAWGPYLIFSV